MKLINYGNGKLELFHEAWPPGKENPSSDSEPDMGDPGRSAKRRRIEQHAQDYLKSRPIFIMSALLKGPFNSEWTNPWRDAKTSDTSGARSKSNASARAGGSRVGSTVLAKTHQHGSKNSQLRKRAKVSKKTAFSKELGTTVPEPSVKRSSKNRTVSLGSNKTQDAKGEQMHDTVEPVVPGRPFRRLEQAKNSNGTLLANEPDRLAQDQNHQSNASITIGFTPINVRTDTYRPKDLSPLSCASKSGELDTRHLQRPGASAQVIDLNSERDDERLSHKINRNLEALQSTEDARKSEVSQDGVSHQSAREAAFRCTQSGTASRIKNGSISRKNQRRTLPASNPNQAVMKCDTSSPFVFQRRTEINRDDGSHQAPLNHKDIQASDQGQILQTAPALEVSCGEDWAIIQQFTNSILPVQPPDTTPSKKISTHIRNVLRTSGASILSDPDNVEAQAVEINDGQPPISPIQFKQPNPKKLVSETVPPDPPSATASCPTDINSQIGLRLTQRALEDTLISPAELHNTPHNDVVATPSIPPYIPPADSTRKITLTGPHISTQDVLTGVSPFAFNTIRKPGLIPQGRNNEVRPEGRDMPLTENPAQESGGRDATSRESRSPGTVAEASTGVNGLDGSFDLNEAIEDFSVFLRDSIEFEGRTAEKAVNGGG
ncbi:hypothetical protein EV356DRAFT_504163 [Viridothelium virens]|uniref:Uncharacterized protein n=1 Tax=Viridothelium virens TaxID=1048519 RepID=A0A6A6HMT1_VIRVR|nr:hypothetical protein EV356DRAFT_504163 [Viridothelium virens]